MTNLAKALAPCKSEMGSSGERDLMLSALRTASARTKLATNVIETIGISLRQKAVSCEQAMAWLKDEDLLHWIDLGPKVKQ